MKKKKDRLGARPVTYRHYEEPHDVFMVLVEADGVLAIECLPVPEDGGWNLALMERLSDQGVSLVCVPSRDMARSRVVKLIDGKLAFHRFI